MSAYSPESLPQGNATVAASLESVIQRMDNQARHALPPDLVEQLINQPIPMDEIGNPYAKRVRIIGAHTLETIVAGQGLDYIDDLAGKPKTVAKKIAQGLFLGPNSHRKYTSSHDAIIAMLTQERGRLPNDEF